MIVHTNEFYCFVKDDDGHNYVIPADKKQEWNDWLDKNISATEPDWDVSEVSWAQSIDGVSSIKFQNPQEF